MHRLTSRIAFFLAALFILGVTFRKPRFFNAGTEATLAWDVSGYYLYLPAIFIYKDLRQVKFLPSVIEKYQPSYAPDQAFPAANGNQVMKYSAGMALMYLPFFAAGHLAAVAFGYPADGFSLPYQVAIHLGGVLVVLLGLWFLRKNLLRFFSEKAVALTLLLIALGTNFLNYSTFDAANVHCWLFALLALLTHFTIRWNERPSWGSSLGIGASVGLMALTRPVEIIYFLLPVLWGIGSLRAMLGRGQVFFQHFPKLLLAAVVAGAIGFIQLAYWKYAAGEWLVYSYQSQTFSFDHPHIADVLFSWRKGWFVYTPLMVFALVGFVFVRNKTYKVSKNLIGLGGGGEGLWDWWLAIFLLFLLNFWIVSAWDIWWYGGAFGQRAMIQAYALLAFPLAAFCEWFLNKNWSKWIFGISIGACVALNLFQTWQAHTGPWEADMMNKAYYLRIFLNTKNLRSDRLLLDTNQGFSGKRQNEKIAYATDFEGISDSSAFARSGARAIWIDPKRLESSPAIFKKTAEMTPGKWLHVGGWFYSPQPEGEVWWMPQCVVVFQKDGQLVSEKLFRPHHVIDPEKWMETGVDLKVPKQDFDEIKVFLRNPRERVGLFLDDLTVTAF